MKGLRKRQRIDNPLAGVLAIASVTPDLNGSADDMARALH
jgi:hypothetical protein